MHNSNTALPASYSSRQFYRSPLKPAACNMVSWQYGIDTHYVYMTEPSENAQ